MTKINNQLSKGPLRFNLPNGPLEMASLDLMGSLPREQCGVQYILTVLDIFSKYIRLYAIRRANTETILKRVITDFIPKIGRMTEVITDNGTQFRSRKWIKTFQELGVTTKFTSSYHPESNPVERANRKIGRLLRTYCHDKPTRWANWLEHVEYCLNHTSHASTELTPQQVLFGHNDLGPIEEIIRFPAKDKVWLEIIIELAKEKLFKKAYRRKQKADADKKFVKYIEGQEVLVKNHSESSAINKEIKKFFLIYEGPYKIIKV